MLGRLGRVLAVAIAVLSLQEGPDDIRQNIGGRWMCRWTPVIVAVPVLRLLFRLVIRLIGRCVRIPIFGRICWIVGIQFVLVVSWIIVRVLRVYRRWVCNWVPYPWWHGEGRTGTSEER